MCRKVGYIPFPFIIFNIELIERLVVVPPTYEDMQPKDRFRKVVWLLGVLAIWREPEYEFEVDRVFRRRFPLETTQSIY